MRKLKVRHQRLPGVGELFELETAAGMVVSVVGHRSGRRELVLGEPGAEEPLATARLTKSEATAVATLLLGSHVELTIAPTS